MNADAYSDCRRCEGHGWYWRACDDTRYSCWDCIERREAERDAVIAELTTDGFSDMYDADSADA